jgi:DNA-binding transcriptional MerR regulator
MPPLPTIDTVSDEPLYNIGVVARMTGISMATLRAWERRYDFPVSKRTLGGHRLYSEKDVLRLRWVKSRISEGMQTAQAINALKHQEQTGHFILTEHDLAEEPAPNGTALRFQGREISSGDKLHLPVFQERLAGALQERDIPLADEVMAEALAFSTPEDLILSVIAPTLNQMGLLWEKGSIGVDTEHLGTNYLRHRLLMWMLSGPPPQTNQPIVLACAPAEWHEGSLLILGALLRRRRWLVSYLGQSVPLPDLANFVRELKPSILVTVAMTENSATELVDWPHFMPEIVQDNYPIFGYGGRVFVENPEWRMKMRGMYLGNTFEEGVATIERLLQPG